MRARKHDAGSRAAPVSRLKEVQENDGLRFEEASRSRGQSRFNRTSIRWSGSIRFRIPQIADEARMSEREVQQYLEDFFGGRKPSHRSFLEIGKSRRAKAGFGAIPAVAVTETDKAYEIISQLPVEMDEKNVGVRFADGVLTIKGEKQEEREERKKGYHMRERSFGSFERTFQVPEGIDADKAPVGEFRLQGTAAPFEALILNIAAEGDSQWT
jgi:HSP20 family molecular chaperone IbpA